MYFVVVQSVFDYFYSLTFFPESTFPRLRIENGNDENFNENVIQCVTAAVLVVAVSFVCFSVDKSTLLCNNDP